MDLENLVDPVFYIKWPEKRQFLSPISYRYIIKEKSHLDRANYNDCFSQGFRFFFKIGRPK